MQPPPSPPRPDPRRAFLAIALWLAASASAVADNAVIPDTPQQMGLRGSVESGLQLQAFLNGRDTHQIVAINRDARGRLLVKRADLAAIGLKTELAPAGAEVALDALAGVKCVYNEGAQTLSIEAPMRWLAPQRFSAAPPRANAVAASSDWGAALNYDLYAATASWWLGRRLALGSGSLGLDGRAFSPFGVFSQSGILGATAFDAGSALRLDTTWRLDDDAHGETISAGDLISGGLPWTRPIRMGGVQIQQGFGLRPDLIAGPTATVSGTAMVPSSVDVFVNDLRLYSQPVEPGPFRIDNLPAISGAGAATLVMHDVTGKETTTSAPFFVSSRLLPPGGLNYSVEAGFARRNYGVSSFDYDPHLIASASIRGGLTDWVTLEGHAEGGAGLINGGVGASLDAFHRAVIDVSLAGDRYDNRFAGQVSLDVSTNILGAVLDLSTQRALSSYMDLAAVTAPETPTAAILPSLLASPLLLSTSVAPPRALDRVSISFPRIFNFASLNFAFVNQVECDGSVSRLASLGLSRSFHGVSAFVTGFADFSARRSFGVVAGVSFALGDVAASTQSSLQAGAFSQLTSATRPAGQQAGDYGWSVEDQEGANRYVRASAAYQSAVGRATVTAGQFGAGPTAAAGASAEFVGSAAALGGGMALAPHISDSFAMVDVGAPGVAVLEDNRLIGRTDASGRLLAPDLRGFENNRIGIDATTLPLDSRANATELVLRPRSRSGVVADFRVASRAQEAEVTLVDDKGVAVLAGAQAERAGHAAATVGYDGRVYLDDLGPHNELTVRSNGQTCRASFDFTPARSRARPLIGPIVCKPAERSASSAGARLPGV